MGRGAANEAGGKASTRDSSEIGWRRDDVMPDPLLLLDATGRGRAGLRPVTSPGRSGALDRRGGRAQRLRAGAAEQDSLVRDDVPRGLAMTGLWFEGAGFPGIGPAEDFWNPALSPESGPLHDVGSLAETVCG